MKNKHWYAVKIIIVLAAAVITASVFLGCKGSSGSSQQEKTFDKDASYALGLNIGASFRDGLAADGIHPDIDEFLKGLKDGITDSKARFDLFTARDMIEAAFNALVNERNEELIKKENEFLAENARKPGVMMTSSGLQYEIIKEGYGEKPANDDIVVVHYEGKLTNGQFFDSSYTRGIPAEFQLDHVIEGWSEGLQLMRLGSKYILYVPSGLGYGEEGEYDPWTQRQIIPPFATLIFEVELLEIKKWGDE